MAGMARLNMKSPIDYFGRPPITLCTTQKTNSSAPMTILVHQELSVPSKAIRV
jgi:hypothetical protein